jgi:hypothetical protein
MVSLCNTKQFNEIYKIRHFHALQVSFWDSEEKIKQNYEALKKLLEENNKKPKDQCLNLDITPESLKESYNFLTKKEERENYLNFLKYYYFLSEPITLNQLKKNFSNKIFPFYIFTIKIKEKQQISTIIIDFVEKKISILYKEKEFYSIKSGNIVTVNKKFGTTIIIMSRNENYIEGKSKPKDEFKEISFEPELIQQIDLIYTIISYFAKSIDDNNFYELLEDDCYRPFGIILRTKIIKEHRVKVYGKDDRYAVLGPSMIIIYKNEEMKDIRNILPLFPLFMRVNFVEKEKKIIFKYPSREQALSFFDNEHYTMWETTLKELFNRRIKCKMDTLSYFQVNENKDKDKIIKEIEVEIQCAEEEINALKKKMETTRENFLKKIEIEN